MAWNVEVSNEFREWYQNLSEGLRASIAAGVDVLEQLGPEAGRPFVDTLKGSKHPNLKELRIQHRGRPYRVLFMLDPKRNVYLILGGDKSGDPHWYRDAFRRAERIYERYLDEIGGE